MKDTKKIITISIVIVVALILGVLGWYVLRTPKFMSTEYIDIEEDDGVKVYDGKKYRYNEHLSNYLFLGVDKRVLLEEEVTPGEAGQADAILLVSYNRLEGTIRCLSIPRDTMTAIRTYSQEGDDLGKSKDHLNVQYAFGDGRDESCQLMIEAVESLLFDVSIQGYCAVSMDGIPTAVETVGQVELVVPDDTLADVSEEFQKGNKVIITKDNAEQFVRYRDKEVRQSAMQRGSRQKVFIKAFAEVAKGKAAKDERLITTMYENLKPYMVTNMGNDVFAKILQAKNASENMFTDVPGKAVNGADFDEYHVDQDGLYKLVLEMFYEEVQED